MSDEPPIFSINELRSTGLLWLINRVVFHPRGLALALTIADDGTIKGWSLLGDGTECWTMTEEMDDRGFERSNAFLAAQLARAADQEDRTESAHGRATVPPASQGLRPREPRHDR